MTDRPGTAVRTPAEPVPVVQPPRARVGSEQAACLLLALIAAGALLVLRLWWADTPAVTGTADWITSCARLCGLLAGYTAPVLVVLMARIPLLDHVLGTDRLARWHAHGGRYLVSLVVAHVTLIIWGYTLTDHSNVVSQTDQLVFHYPDMLKATLGTLLLFAVGAVSARAARRRLSYETWHLLHLGTYVALFLVFFHQLSNGAQFVSDAAARAAWYALYLTAAALILAFRAGVPLYRHLRHDLRVAEVREEAPGVVSVLLTGRHLERFPAAPGQFLRWRFLAPGLRLSANPYSLSAPASPAGLRITVKAAGGHSAALAGVAPGTRVLAEGPYGAFTPARRTRRKVLLIAGGVGITPLRPLFETLPGEVTLLFRASTEADLLFRDELDALASADGRTVHYLPGPRTPDPLSARRLLALVPDVRDHDVYLCGPEGMVAAVRESLDMAGVPAGRIHHETFAL